MAVTKKQDSSNNKKTQGRKAAIKRDDSAGKVIAKRDVALSKEKKEVTRKETPVRKDLPAKKDRVNYLEQVQKFFKGAFNELKKVHWPNRREITIYTLVVLVAVAAVGVLIWLFDSALSFILKFIV